MSRRVLAIWSRKLHRWGTVAVFLPLLIVIVTGVLLLWKKDVAWIQPPTLVGAAQIPTVSFEELLEASRGVPEANITGWHDIDRLDVRPDDGVVKVRSKNSWEIQIDTATGEVLHIAYRRSDLIEALHDGSWFHDKVKLAIFFPASLFLLVLWLTGLYLFYLPHGTRWFRKQRRLRKPLKAIPSKPPPKAAPLREEV